MRFTDRLSSPAPLHVSFTSSEKPDQIYSKTCVKRPLPKRPKIGFQDQLSLYAGQKHCRMPKGGHSAILLTFIKLPFVIKIFVVSVFEWPFYTVFTVHVAPSLLLVCILNCSFLRKRQLQINMNLINDTLHDEAKIMSLASKKKRKQWQGPPWLNLRVSLARTICESWAFFFVSS